MFPQNRSGKPLLSTLMLALILVISSAWFHFLPSTDPKFPPVHDTTQASITPAAHPEIPTTQVATPVLNLIPKAEAAPLHIGTPVRLSITGTNIDFPVIDLGLLPDGKLDAPKDGKTLGWYRLGPKPGQKGNSVIDGHLTTVEGPGAFWNLKHVRVGDRISVTDDQGVTRTFKVRKTAVYHVNAAPMLEIFGSAPGKHLNLITCAGVWDTAMDHYDKRLVVYTDLVE
jgi:LPXTG-site transpeptidase (sortase) family protein